MKTGGQHYHGFKVGGNCPHCRHDFYVVVMRFRGLADLLIVPRGKTVRSPQRQTMMELKEGYILSTISEIIDKLKVIDPDNYIIFLRFLWDERLLN